MTFYLYVAPKIVGILMLGMLSLSSHGSDSSLLNNNEMVFV